MTRVLLAHAADGASYAADVTAQLVSLGYAVDTLHDPPRTRGAQLASARHVLLLWSRDAARMPLLRGVARRARNAGKLACVLLDKSRPPRSLCGARAIILPRGRASGRAWRQLLEQTSMPPEPDSAQDGSVSAGSNRLGGLGVTFALALSVAIAFYASNAGFNARVNTLASDLQARAAAMVAE